MATVTGTPTNGMWSTLGRVLLGALAGWLVSTLTNFWIFTERERVLNLRIEQNTNAIVSMQEDIQDIQRSVGRIERAVGP